VGLVAIGLALALATLLWNGRSTVFLPGTTSDGHYLIETACESCHVPFAGVSNDRCVACHKAELADDTHPVRMFDDPRWASTLRTIDALQCKTCHQEHLVAQAGVTVRPDFCYPCHDDVTQKRETHRTLGPDSCGSVGCHNYHDNSGLNTAFLRRHVGEPAMGARAGLPERRPALPTVAPPAPAYPAEVAVRKEVVDGWRASAHAAGDVNCMDCHGGSATGFVAVPGERACAECHRFEVETFRTGKHGARGAVDLPPLTPSLARQPMRHDTRAGRGLSCAACHDPHRLDTRRAAVEACLGCHDDEHSRNFESSPHGATLRLDGPTGPTGPGAVTCATCHLPRTRVEGDMGPRVAVNHNNTFTLRPRDRMVKEVCAACHGLEFSLSNIVDDTLVRSNFRGRSTRRHETFRMMDAVAPATPGGETR
jgi:predicted CXXCH cytochrome family protein